MFLSDVDILKATQKGDIVIKPFNKKKLQPVSYDISLGNKFIVNDENMHARKRDVSPPGVAQLQKTLRDIS